MIIKDKSLEPYLIESNSNSFNVGKMVKGVFKTETYHTSIENAVLKVATLKMAEGADFLNLKEYLTAIKNVKDEILKGISVSV